MNIVSLYICELYKDVLSGCKFKLMYVLCRIFLIGNIYMYLVFMGLKFVFYLRIC